MSLSTMAPMPAPTNPPLRSIPVALPAPHAVLRAAHEGPPTTARVGVRTAPSGGDWVSHPSEVPDALRQTLSLVLQPEVRTALQAPPSTWFALAERLAATEPLSAYAVASLFDADLLASMGLTPSDPWIAFATRRLHAAATAWPHPTAAPTASPAATAETPGSAVSLRVGLTDESESGDAHPAPPQIPPEAVAASPEPPDEITAPPERMIRLLPVVTQSVTAGASSVEALATAVFTHLTGRAA